MSSYGYMYRNNRKQLQKLSCGLHDVYVYKLRVVVYELSDLFESDSIYFCKITPSPKSKQLFNSFRYKSCHQKYGNYCEAVR